MSWTRRAEEAAVALWIANAYRDVAIEDEGSLAFSAVRRAKNTYDELVMLLHRDEFRVAKGVSLILDYWPSERGIRYGYEFGLTLILGSREIGRVDRLWCDLDDLCIGSAEIYMTIRVPGLAMMADTVGRRTRKPWETPRYKWLTEDTIDDDSIMDLILEEEP